MSIALVQQVYHEAKRLAVAGSIVAAGDFRLRKLLPPLEQAGAKAPVFGKIAEAARNVIEAPEKESAGALLELATLVTAVLYTQGSTGADGELQPLATNPMQELKTETRASQLKPILDAFRSTGSGRYEVIKEAYEQKLFNDLRLIQPAIDGIDDKYSELAELVSEKILPQYGKPIWPLVREKYEPAGKQSHARRLKLLFQLDPVATRPLVEQALEQGSKEVKVAAIACLGDKPEDLTILLDQVRAKTQDVRAAAYRGLARLDHADAEQTLRTAIKGKDATLVQTAIGHTERSCHTQILVDELSEKITLLRPNLDKKQLDEAFLAIFQLMDCLPIKKQPSVEAILLRLFRAREDYLGLRGTHYSGQDLLNHLCVAMSGKYDQEFDEFDADMGEVDSNGTSATLQQELASAHRTMPVDNFSHVAFAALRTMTPKQFYEGFSVYLQNHEPEKKGKKSATNGQPEILSGKWDEVLTALGWNPFFHYGPYQFEVKSKEPLDPRWLDLAIQHESIELIYLMRPIGHAAVNAMLERRFQALITKQTKGTDTDGISVVTKVMATIKHPGTTGFLLEFIFKLATKSHHYFYEIFHQIPLLPKSALPELEAATSKIPQAYVQHYLDALEKLRTHADEPGVA